MASSKLTKKQKKALTFRNRKGQKSSLEEGLYIPETDPLVESADGEQPLSESDKRTEPLETDSEFKKNDENLKLRKRKRGVKDGMDTSKDIEETVDELDLKKKKRRKVVDTEGSSIPEGDTKTAGTKTKTKTKPEDSSNQRFILFVGNLKYTTSIDAIQEHFSKCDPPPQVRLLTPKPKAPGTTSTKSKGCAFLEFSHRNALQQGIKLHGSTLDGRRINVELTAGGGGKSEHRVKKVQERNKHLLEERKQRIQKKLDAGENIDTIVTAPPQRHSTTSGIDHVSQKKRTWSVPEHEETGGRGGAKKRGKNTKLLRKWATGANAITVS